MFQPNLKSIASAVPEIIAIGVTPTLGKIVQDTASRGKKGDITNQLLIMIFFVVFDVCVAI